MRLAWAGLSYTVGTATVTPKKASELCWSDPNLPRGGVLAPAAHILTVLPDIVAANSAALGAVLVRDPAWYATGGGSLWVMDPYGGCRAVTLPLPLHADLFSSAMEVVLAPCAWVLQYVCMDVEDAELLASQVRSSGVAP